MLLQAIGIGSFIEVVVRCWTRDTPVLYQEQGALDGSSSLFIGRVSRVEPGIEC